MENTGFEEPGVGEIIDSIRRARENEVRFFSNNGKSERERWVVGEFLSRLSITFSPEEMISQVEASDIDVVFRDMNFQVKELTEPNCRRGSELKEDLKRAESATNLSEIFGPLNVLDKVHRDAFPLIFDFANDLGYPLPARGKLDLLIYVTDTSATLNLANQPKELSGLGWRSISCLFGSRAYVLVASRDAPEAIRRHGTS